MRRALRGSDGRFFGGGGGSSKGTQQDQDKENETPNNLNEPSNITSISASVPTIKEDIVLTNKNILRPKRENSEEKNTRRMSTPIRMMNDSEEGMVSPLTPAQQVVVNRSRHIRFDLPDSPATASPSMNETLTPPPKEFKRANYKTLRAERCLSTVVTEKEWAVVRDMERLKSQEQQVQEASPKPPQGIVRSLCRLYSKENVVSPVSSSSIRRSSSFDGRNNKATLAVVVDHGQHSPATSETSDASMSYGKASSVSPGSEASTSEVHERKGSFRLFRSRSWSLRRKRGEQQKQPKRCSPSCSSTKSQDSGFSDNENKNVRPSSTPPTSRSMGTSTRDEEDEEDPNLTQVPSGQKVSSYAERKIYQYSPPPPPSSSSAITAQDNQRRQREWLLRQERGEGERGVNDNVDKSRTLPAVSPTSPSTTNNTSSPRRAVASSLGNIASLQEGLRIKARLCEEEERESRNSSGQNSRQSLSATNLLKAACEEEENKASKQFYFADVKRYQEKLKEQQRRGVFDYRSNNVVVENDIDISRLSEFEIDGGGRAPAFSTPVRASFRQRNHAVRSMIESARTPIKAEGGRTRPREVKRNTDERQRRCRSSDASHYEPNIHDRSEVPSTIDPSMVAVWSRFLNYEATVPELSSLGPLTPEVGLAADEDNVSYSTSVRQLLIKGEASRRNRMPSSPERLREAGRQFFEEDERDLTRLSHLPSYAVDGTETQLLVESLNRTRPKRLSDALIFAEGSLAESQTSMKGLLPPVLDQSTLLSQSPPAFVMNVPHHPNQQHPNQHQQHPSPPASMSDSRNSSSCSSSEDNNNQQQQQQQQRALRSPNNNMR